MNAKAPPKADAAVVCLYGGMGQGKSVENIYSWAARGLFLAQPGALRGGITVVGYDVSSQTQACSRLEDVPYWIEYAKEHGFEAVVIDDASLMMHNTQNLSRSMFETPGKPGTYDFGMYTYWENQVTNVAYHARWAGIHVIMNFHEQAAFVDKKSGEQYLAGPDLGWKKLVRRIPHTACVVGHVVKPPYGTAAWDTRMDCDNRSVSHMMKDRFDVAPMTGAPLNTAELLRAAGYQVSRPQGLEWMETIAEGIHARITGGGKEAAVLKRAKEHLLKQNINPLHIRWALRDGAHRSRFRQNATESVLAGF